MQNNSKNTGRHCTDHCMCCEQDNDERDNADQGRIPEADDEDKEY